MFQLNFVLEGGGRQRNYSFRLEQEAIVRLLEEHAEKLLTAVEKALEDGDEEALELAEEKLLEPDAVMWCTRVKLLEQYPDDCWVRAGSHAKVLTQPRKAKKQASGRASSHSVRRGSARARRSAAR